MISQATNEVKT